MSLKQWRRRFSDPVVYGMVLVVWRAFGACSDGMARRLARWGGGVLWRGHGAGRRLVLANLALAFPEKDAAERHRIGRESVVHAVWNGIDFARSARHPEAIHQRVAISDRMHEDFQVGRPGRLLVLGHLGSWELLGHALPAAGSAGYAVAHPMRNARLDRLLTRARGATGLGILPSDGAVRGVLKAWKNGMHVAVLADQNTRLVEGGIFVDFFGLPVTITRAPAMLARKLDLPVSLGSCIRDASGRFHADAEPLSRPAAAYASDAELSQEMMASLERRIRVQPEQYVWMYKRWRYVPADAPPEVAARYPYYARICEEGTGQWTKS